MVVSRNPQLEYRTPKKGLVWFLNCTSILTMPPGTCGHLLVIPVSTVLQRLTAGVLPCHPVDGSK